MLNAFADNASAMQGTDSNILLIVLLRYSLHLLLTLMCSEVGQRPVLSLLDFNWQSVLRFQMEINTVLEARPVSAGETITDASMLNCNCHKFRVKIMSYSVFVLEI